jgi:hypothetical protein
MNFEIPVHLRRVRQLSHALMISGVINIGVLALLIYWMMHERPPTPYCELKPATYEQQQIPLADLRNATELLNQLSQLPFTELAGRLQNRQVVENGYAERDLALACLVAFHHFDMVRALPKSLQPKQKRLFAWKPDAQNLPFTLAIYPALTDKQFSLLYQFATTERWPLTAEGLYALLQTQKSSGSFDSSLVETFFLTPEFWTVERLLNRADRTVKSEEMLDLLLEGSWPLLKQFVTEQRKLHDQSSARRLKFLLDYLKAGSPAAARLLVKTEWDFAIMKLEDHQVIALLKQLPIDCVEGVRFAKELLASPRSSDVWQQAAIWLYSNAGEEIPKKWEEPAVLQRFAVSKKLPVVVKPKPVPAAVPAERPKEKPSSAAVRPTPAPQPQPQPSRPQTYIVQKGDSLWKISKKFNVKIDRLKAENKLESDTLTPGKVLKIPS